MIFSTIGECCIYFIFGYDVPYILPQSLFQRLTRKNEIIRRIAVGLAFAVGLPWLLDWWGPSLTIKQFFYFSILGLRFDFDYEELLQSLRPSIKGVLHCGASVAQEADIYKKLKFDHVFWIEAQPDLCSVISQKLTNMKLLPPHSSHVVQCATLWDATGQILRFRLTNNSISSSLFPLGRAHKRIFPFVRDDQFCISVRTMSLDDLFFPADSSQKNASGEWRNREKAIGKELGTVSPNVDDVKGTSREHSSTTWRVRERRSHDINGDGHILGTGTGNGVGERGEVYDSSSEELKLDEDSFEEADTWKYNFMYLDVQGSELHVLRGGRKKVLPQIDFILSEVSVDGFFEGGTSLFELDKFLQEEGFDRKPEETLIPPCGHGNALYRRVPRKPQKQQTNA